jgi:hypothetical protein
MGVRKNAKYLTASERQDLVQALVMMKADPVPGRPYNWFDGFALIHRYIQSVSAPAVPGGSPAAGNVNFGHNNAAFGPWHRYFLLRFEQQLQSYVPGVMLPYWDWTDPLPDVMVASFMGPNGSGANWEISQGYFAGTAPGNGGNATALPPWWPAGLNGWTVAAAWGEFSGPLRRSVGNTVLPPSASIRNTLEKADYASFRAALESGVGVVPASTMHAAIHAWFNDNGANAQIRNAQAAALDPMFYLHHANVDRLWAMWQMDGHGNDYPADGAVANHHRLDDPMFPWVGAAGGYSPNGTLPGMPNLPDFSGDPVVTAADVMDHRALGYSYDTMVTMGIALDRTGSMLGSTPDPMTGMGNVSKWEAAKQGVSAFLQDCEAAYESNEAYVLAGVETFRSLASNQFTQVFAGTPYGVIKSAGSYSQAAFDAAIAAQTPGGGTPLADALIDTFDSLVQPPFAGLPADEPRYLALFTDGMLTSGSPLASIPNGSLDRTAVFAMGFGHAGDVDYPTLAQIVAKGELPGQVFHGENAGQIDKFFSDALAAAIGYTPIMDPVLEMCDGEHAHLDFTATTAEAAFYITAQGMDHDDAAWSYQLIGPDGAALYIDGSLPQHDHGGGGGGHSHGGGADCRCVPQVTARRRRGRLTLFVQRNHCDDAAWVGQWMLLVARRARDFDAMLMPANGALMFPVAAGPSRGPRYSKLLIPPTARVPARHVPGPATNALDVVLNSTNRSDNPCSVVINIYARTSLRFRLIADGALAGEALEIALQENVLAGRATVTRSAVRAISPRVDLRALLPEPPAPPHRSRDPKNDTARVLARLERDKPGLFAPVDEAAELVSHHGGGWHYHVKVTAIPGAYHFGVHLQGIYDPGGATNGGHAHEHGDKPGLSPSRGGGSHAHPEDGSHHGSEGEHAAPLQHFQRILSVTVGLSGKT